MVTPASSACIFRFGQFEADTARNTLFRNGARIKIQDQPFRVLVLLLQSNGEIVTRETLRQRLWPDGTFVDFDGSLNVILKKLRASLDDDADNPRFIETVPRHGYRFIAPVSRANASGVPARSVESSRDDSPSGQERATPSPQYLHSNGIPSATMPIEAVRKPRSSTRLLLSLSVAAVFVACTTGWMLRHQMAALMKGPR